MLWLRGNGGMGQMALRCRRKGKWMGRGRDGVLVQGWRRWSCWFVRFIDRKDNNFKKKSNDNAFCFQCYRDGEECVLL